MRRGTIIAALAAMGGMVLTGGASAETIVMQKSVAHPHAGVLLAVPEGFSYQNLIEPYDVMRAVLTKRGKGLQAVALSAHPVAQDTTAEMYVKEMMEGLKETLAIRQLKVLKTVEMPVAGLTGVAQKITYTFRGVKTLAAQVYFVRDVASPKGLKLRICYVLTVESDTESEATLLPVLGEVIKTVKLVALRHPFEVPVTELAEPIEDKERGYSIRPPRGWTAGAASAGVVLSQTDYLLGGIPMPTVRVLVGDVPAGLTDRDRAAECIKMARKVATERHLAAKVLSEGQAKLGGVDGYQFVLAQSPETRPIPEPGGEKAPERVIIIHRLACLPAVGGHQAGGYSLVLVCQGGDVKALEAIIEKISGGFRFLRPTSQPTTSTAPTTQKAATTRPNP